LLPANLVCCELRGRAALPRFLWEADRPWIRRLVDACDHAAGRPIRDLDERLREPIPGVPEDKRRLVAHVLLGLARSRVGSALPPREARARVFAAAAGLPAHSSAEAIAACAAELRVAPEALRDALFADLPGERLALPPTSLDPGELALRANLLLAQSLLARAFRVGISLEGNARAVVRHASLRGLICSVTPGPAGEGARLEVSGPFALFRRTLLYGRALGSLLPVLAWTTRFRLDADCELRGRAATVTLASGDPIFLSAEPRRFDSQVEERFARDFGRAAPAWTVVREPEPIQAGGHLVFPDFAIHRRHDSGARWLVEIVGFWTAEYLAAKLERLREARIANLVLCIDEERNVGPSDLPPSARVVRYRRRVDPSAVLRAISAE
jgi:predicted nuclease of restriction endonuclease-like RecB superfamily